MPQTIRFTAADVGAAAGDGRRLTEEALAGVLGLPAALWDFVESGYTVSLAGGLNVEAAAGVARIAGYRVEDTGTLSVACPNNATSGIYLRLDRTAGRVTGASLAALGSVTPDVADAVLLAVVVATAGSLGSLRDERRRGIGLLSGEYAGNGATSRTISTGRTPQLVLVASVDGGSAVHAVSGPRVCGARDFHTDGNSEVGFRLMNRNLAVAAVPAILTASQTWDPPAGTTTGVVDVSVPGARVGNLVSVSHPNIPTVGDGNETLSGVVRITDSVRVTYSKNGQSRDPASGTLSVLVVQPSIASAAATFLGNAAALAGRNPAEVPWIVQDGFDVGHPSSVGESLNASGRDYAWLALL